MRSKSMTAAAVAASMLLAAGAATADPVQEQLRLMEERMAEMEDRLQATSDQLKKAEATVQQQQATLTDAGLAEDEGGARSAVGNFFQMIDVSGLVAASYNGRLAGWRDRNNDIAQSFRHQNANTFSLDQLWLSLDKPVNEESRGGFHADILYGESARVMRNSRVGGPLDETSEGGEEDEDDSWDDIYLFGAYVSYLAPVGNGIRFDLGKRPTLMGVERIKTNLNYNVTQGRVFQLIPIVNTGLLAETNLTDQISIATGVFNDVYADTSIDDSRHKAYFGQVAYKGDMFGFKVDTMVGKNSSAIPVSGGNLVLQNDAGGDCTGGQACKTAVLEAVATAQLSDSLEGWLQFVWSRHFGNSILEKGDVHAIATAARFHITEDTSIATRAEYLRTDSEFQAVQELGNQMDETFTLTFTGAQALTDSLTLRGELRWDRNLTSENQVFAIDNSLNNNGTRNDQVLGIAELYYAF